MTGSVVPTLFRRTRTWRGSICMLLVAGAACFSDLGCASARRDGPAPRVRDAAALDAESAAQPTDPEPLYQTALLHYSRHEPEAALRALHDSLLRDAGYVPALTLLAKLLHDTGHSAEGVRYFAARPLASWPDPVRLNLALLHADTGNSRLARQILESLAGGPYADAARVNLAYLDLLDDKPEVAALAQLADRHPGSPEVLNNLALAKLRTGDVEGSVQLLRDLASHYPDFATGELNLALVLGHYLFDEDGAARLQRHVDAIVPPRLDEASLQQLLQPSRVEDTAPTPRSGVAPERARAVEKEKRP